MTVTTLVQTHGNGIVCYLFLRHWFGPFVILLEDNIEQLPSNCYHPACLRHRSLYWSKKYSLKARKAKILGLWAKGEKEWNTADFAFHCVNEGFRISACYEIQIIMQKEILNGSLTNIHLDSFMYKLILPFETCQHYLKYAIFLEIWYLLSLVWPLSSVCAT